MTNARKYHFTVLEALSTKLKQLKYVYYIINDDKDYNAYIIPTLELKEMIEQKKYFKTVRVEIDGRLKVIYLNYLV